MDFSYSHHLLAVVGWLELGDSVAAYAELESIAPEFQTHPDVMQVRWLICATEQKWNICRDIALIVTQKSPERASGWVHFAYSMRRCDGGSVEAARKILLEAVAKFPGELNIHYNLACYDRQLGNNEEARTHLKKSLSLGEPKKVKSMVWEDTDLEPLWPDIAEI